MNIKKLASGAGLTLALSLTLGTAQASLLSFEDDDIDFIQRSGSIISSGTLAAGDVFISVFEIPTYKVNGVNGIPAGQELTGIAAVELLSITGSGAGAIYTFGASTFLNNTYGTGVGSAIAMWFNGAPGTGTDRDLELNRTSLPATNCTSFADCTDQASRGSLFQVDGFTGDVDEFWSATQILPGGGDIGTVLTTDNSTIVSAFNFALMNIFNASGKVGYIDVATGLQVAANCNTADPGTGCVQIKGSGTLTGGQGLVNGAVAHSDFDAQKYTVPEPGVLALLGVALLGFGSRSRKGKA